MGSRPASAPSPPPRGTSRGATSRIHAPSPSRRPRPSGRCPRWRRTSREGDVSGGGGGSRVHRASSRWMELSISDRHKLRCSAGGGGRTESAETAESRILRHICRSAGDAGPATRARATETEITSVRRCRSSASASATARGPWSTSRKGEDDEGAPRQPFSPACHGGEPPRHLSLTSMHVPRVIAVARSRI
eukprot:COSAG01_NODE_1314_length_10760_cov_3.305131_10_plen_191_part_00